MVNLVLGVLVSACVLSGALGSRYAINNPIYARPHLPAARPPPHYAGGLTGLGGLHGGRISPLLKNKCGHGLVRKIDGSCVKPIVNKNIFLYNAPEMKIKYGPAPKIPDPSIDYNYVFIRAPNAVVGPEPLVVPPTQQKTLVYVLSEQPKLQQQSVIEVPSAVTQPEVFFINYNEGENPTLPGGIDLQTALSQSATLGKVVGGGPGPLGGGGLKGGLIPGGLAPGGLIPGGHGLKGGLVGGYGGALDLDGGYSEDKSVFVNKEDH